jgi:hypothetical protein
VSWKKIQLKQYLDYIHVVNEKYDTLMDKRVSILSILLNEDIEKIEAFSIDEFNKYEKDFEFIKHLPRLRNKSYTKLRLEQWIDAEALINDMDNVGKILDIVNDTENSEELTMDVAWNYWQSYVDFRQMIINDSGLFDVDEHEDNSEEEEEEEGQDLSNYTYEIIVNKLAHDDITKYRAVLELPLILCINYLSLKKGKII